MLKMAIITGFLSQTKDRFHAYNRPLDLDQKFELLSRIDGYDGVEIVYPYEVNDPVETRKSLDRHGLNVAAVNANVKAEPEFRNGGLTSRSRQVRDKAVRFIKEAKDFAQAVGADKVTCCPLGDGYEFAFQYDYAQAWKFLVETFGEAGGYKTEIPLFVEYKPSETRGRCFVDTAAKSLCLLNDIGCDQIGITLDFGHRLIVPLQLFLGIFGHGRAVRIEHQIAAVIFDKFIILSLQDFPGRFQRVIAIPIGNGRHADAVMLN